MLEVLFDIQDGQVMGVGWLSMLIILHLILSTIAVVVTHHDEGRAMTVEDLVVVHVVSGAVSIILLLIWLAWPPLVYAMASLTVLSGLSIAVYRIVQRVTGNQ